MTATPTCDSGKPCRSDLGERSLRSRLAALIWIAALPTPAGAWGYEGHRIVATIARGYLRPDVAQQIDALLAADTDTLVAHNMVEAATWADTYRQSHRETSDWHFVDLELAKPDMTSACFGFPPPAQPVSAGPEKDCIVDRTNLFLAELKNPSTPQAEKIIALKFVLHFIGDLHQPLHVSDDQNHGGNCVRLDLGGPRSTTLHSFWDTGLIEAGFGKDPQAVAASLAAQITPAERKAWEAGDPTAWAMESFGVAKASVYTIGSKPGCDADAAPISLPAGYEDQSKTVVAAQLKKAGVRLAWVLNRSLSH
jgi:hypothetical protein